MSKVFKMASVVCQSSAARSSRLALSLISPTFPTGSKYAPLYLSGKFLTRGEAAAKHDVYAPGSGRMKKSSMTTFAKIGQGVRSAKVLTSPGWIGMDKIGMLDASSRFWSSREKSTHASLVMAICNILSTPEVEVQSIESTIARPVRIEICRELRVKVIEIGEFQSRVQCSLRGMSDWTQLFDHASDRKRRIFCCIHTDIMRTSEFCFFDVAIMRGNNIRVNTNGLKWLNLESITLLNLSKNGLLYLTTIAVLIPGVENVILP